MKVTLTCVNAVTPSQTDWKLNQNATQPGRTSEDREAVPFATIRSLDNGPTRLAWSGDGTGEMIRGCLAGRLCPEPSAIDSVTDGTLPLFWVPVANEPHSALLHHSY